MKALELALIAILLVTLYATLSTRTLSMKLALENDYWRLKHEATSLARVLADSEVLFYLLEEVLKDGTITAQEREYMNNRIRTIVTALAPPNVEVKVIVVDSNYNTIVNASTPLINECLTAATGKAIYTHSLIGIFLIMVTLGRPL